MPKKRTPAARKGKAKPKRAVSETQRAEDDALRESLRNADLKVLDRALAKAINAARPIVR